MAAIKSYTDLEQSKVLATILPIESADMWWAWYSHPLSNGRYDDFPMFYKPICNPNESVPCWSLTALLSVLPFPVLYMEMLGGMILWSCECHLMETDEVVKMEHYDNPVDACVAMIEKLHKLNLL